MFLAYVRLSKALLISFETEFGPYEKEIAQLCQEVRDEASLASKQAQKQENELQARERSEAGGHRKIIVKLRDSIYQTNKEEKDLRLEIHRRKLEKRKLEALESLSTYNYQKTYNQIRKECVPGTSNWILEKLEFKTWKEGTPKVLWCSGKCKYIKVPGPPAKLIVENSRVREIGHKVHLFENLYRQNLLKYIKRLCDC